jgi:Icc-related predicted phosphoesterase
VTKDTGAFLRASAAPDRRDAAQLLLVFRLPEYTRLPLPDFYAFGFCSPMRALVVADLHYSLPQFDWLLAAAPQFDLVIFAGDALDVGSFVDFRAQIVVVKKYLTLLSGITKVILCSGNHDLDERSAEGEKISRWIGEVRELGIAGDGDSLVIGDTLFTVCPWWDGPLAKQRLEDQLFEASANRPGRWIWVHHAPPANSPTSWGGKRFFGDVDLVQWIARYQPSMVISGHVHQSPFIHDGSWFDRLGDTWVFNTGLQPGRPPVYIVLDIDDGTAFWLAADDARYIDLKAPLSRPALPIVQPPPWLISLDQIADPSLAKPQSAAG